MSLYVSEKVGNEIVLKKYAPAVPVYRGFWAVTIGGFAGTLVECNGSMRYIGSNEKTIYQIVEPGTYTFTATRHGETKSKTIVLDDKDPNNSYTVNLGLYIGMQYLEYIESTGTQYIDTGVVPHDGYSADLTFQFINIVAPDPQYTSNQICGVRQDGLSTRFYPVAISGDSLLRSCYGDTQFAYSVDPLSKHTVNLNKNSHIYLDGTDYGSCATGYVEPSDPQYTMYLFQWNPGSTPSSVVVPCKMRIYEYKLYDNNGTLVSDFLPIKDDTGHGAMYDKITQQIFYNSGEGEFICGPNKPYTRIQYLEGTTCEQYINIGIIPTSDMTYYGKFGFVEFISSQNILQLFGSRNVSGTPNGIYASVRSTGTGLDFFDTNRYELSTSVTRDDIFDFAIEDHVSTIKKNGTVVGTYTFSTTTDTTDYPLHLNALISGGVVDNIKGISRIYSFKVLNHGTLVRDMIPILDNEDVPCMYDRVNDRLYYNNGTGEFRPGIDYLELEYIQNSGSQKIDTGITITDSKRFEIDVQLSSDNPNENSIMGTGGGSDTNFVSIRAGNYFGAESGLQNHFGFIKNQKYYFPGEITKDTNRHLFVIDLRNNKVKIDQYEETTDGTTNSSLTWWIGSYMGSTSSGFDWIGKYYGVKIYNNEELIRDFIPVQRISDSEVCFYDTITREYFVNSGTENWIPGPVKQ